MSREITYENATGIALCRFQIERVMRDVHDLVKHLGEGKIYKHGEYIIGETFP